MRLLILNRSRPSEVDYASILGPLLQDSTMLSEHDGFREAVGHSERFDGFRRNGEVEFRGYELIAAGRVDRVVATSEYDIERAARLREFGGLEGQGLASATAFRDKVTMKDLARRRVGVPASYRRLNSVLDLYEMVEERGFPIVVKPVDGAGSLQASVVEDRASLGDWLAANPVTGFEAESFVRGPMYVVDGLWHDGAIRLAWTSRYVDGCLSHIQGKGVSLVQIGPSHPLDARLKAFCRELFLALPMPDTTSFHAEIFHTPADELVLCEVASRTGGGAIRDLARLSFGVDIHALWIKAQAGIDIGSELAGSREPQSLYGFVQIPPVPGAAIVLPDRIPLGFVISYNPEPSAAKPALPLRESSDKVATVVIEGACPDELESRIDEVSTWMLKAMS